MAAVAGELWPQLALIAAVAASHMSLPHHWLPYSLVGRAHGWHLRSILGLTFLGAFGHVTATLLLTLAISGLSGTLVSDAAYRHLSSIALLLFGLYYLYTYFVSRRRGACCEPGADAAGKSTSAVPASVTPADAPAVHRAAAGSLLLLTTLSPCVGSMPVLIAVLAPPVGITTILTAGGAMLLASAGVMMALVAVSYAGAKTLDFASIRRHERFILGVALVLLAFCTFFVFSHHDHHHHAHDMGGMGATHAGMMHHTHEHKGHDHHLADHGHEHMGHDYHHVDHNHEHMDHDHDHMGDDHGAMEDRVLRTATQDRTEKTHRT